MNKPKHFLAVLVAAFFITFLNPMTTYAMTEDEYYQAIYEQFLEQYQAQYEAQLAAQIEALQEPEVTVTDEEFNALCMVGMNEAGNQGIQGIRYVIACVLNRVDDPKFPNTILGVIYQENQFSTYSRYKPTEEVKEAVRLELKERSNDQIKWFLSTGYYPNYGTPILEYKAHKFSG